MVLTDGETGAIVSRAQLAPPLPWNCSTNGTGSHVLRHHAWANWAAASTTSSTSQLSRLIFRAVIPPLGTATFFLRAATDAESRATTSTGSSSTVPISTVVSGNETSHGFELRNTRLSVRVSAEGLLDSAQLLSDKHLHGPELQLGQDLLLYWGNGGRSAPSSNWDGTGVKTSSHQPTVAVSIHQLFLMHRLVS